MKGLVLSVWFGLGMAGCGPDDGSRGELFATAQRARPIVAVHGHLQTAGNRIVDQNGQTIQLRGVSLFWSQWSGAFWNAKAVHTLAQDWQATVVRAAMGVEDQGGYLSNRNEKWKVRTVVDAAIRAGIYVIIDWHSHLAEQRPGEAIAFFSEMASIYGQTPNVIFEIYNEPKQSSWADIRSYANTVAAAIRSKNARNLIIVGTPQWSQMVNEAADNPVDDGNVAYALHFYAATHRQELRDKALYALEKGVPLFVSEFGTCRSDGDGDYDFVESDRWLQFIDSHGLSWVNWSLFNKPEKASLLNSWAGSQGNWSDGDLTASGHYLRGRLWQDARQDRHRGSQHAHPRP